MWRPPPRPLPSLTVTLGQEDKSADDDNGHDHQLGRCEHVLDVAAQFHAQRVHRGDEHWEGESILCGLSIAVLKALVGGHFPPPPAPPLATATVITRTGQGPLKSRVMEKEPGPSQAPPAGRLRQPLPDSSHTRGADGQGRQALGPG